jgi:RNA polymerase sigma factor (TIGR02999 family)
MALQERQRLLIECCDVLVQRRVRASLENEQLGIEGLRWCDRAHFFAMAATLMRRVLVDYARHRGRDKCGAGVSVTSLDENAIAPQPAVDVVALDEALERLAAVDPQQGRVVELRFFAGLSVEETAEALRISPATVKRDWATAKMWLYNELATR